ncbi:SDR family NAD(P)-dependent oxidoreductase [Noviherbaspirillum sedimenti]|uniref:SDR family oxidoreductase n=1 Tax=Noviherbaspirillum sedimenti TaxID=2320865 RepID=A0A3A3G647_9BURK|nr:glucose 1-dehydrogenase [Noviherbaspirillum sedimenti]RJG03294.1 SDR family oxidoreductase [Noviherbaspirillum sedimenti]
MRLKGKVALITGAGAGIGRACAELFCEQGAKVVIAERDTQTGEAAAAELIARGFDCVFVTTDVSDSDSVKNAVDTTVGTYGKIDVLYNNAGGSTLADGRLTETSFDEFWNKMRVDLFGVWAGCRYALPHMMEAGGGAVINATSVLALQGSPGRDAYTTAKGGIIALTRSLAVEYAPHGIRVNAIAPGVTTTERVKKRLAQANAGAMRTSNRSLLGTIEPREIAYAVQFLASDEAKKITGQVLVVDSGLTIS